MSMAFIGSASRGLSGYDLAIRCPGAPAAPNGVKTVDLRLGDGWDDDPVGRAVEALERSGLGRADFKSRVVLLANDDTGGERETLVLYAALYGLAGRHVDVYAGGTVLELSRPDWATGDLPDAGRPPKWLPWAQAGGPPPEGIPWVPLEGNDPDQVTVIRHANRLRFVAPAGTRPAVEAFVRLAAIRRRPKGERFPHLSTGHEPVPTRKDDPLQGIDLYAVVEAARRYQEEQRRSAADAATVVAPREVSPRLRRIAEANRVDVVSVLQRLGFSQGESGKWRCPWSGAYPDSTLADTVQVTDDNRARCKSCPQWELAPVALVAETRESAPDEAVSFVLDDDAAVEVGATVTARVTGVETAGYTCTVDDGGRNHAALLFRPRHGDLPEGVQPVEWSAGDRVTAMVTDVRPGPDGRLVLSATAPELVTRILGVFVDELCSGRVVIMKVARVVGTRTKVAIARTTESGSDARGAVIGHGAARLRGAQRMLDRAFGRERLEIIDYARDPRTYLVNAMKPTRVEDLLIRDGHAVVAVERHLYRGGIGQGGLNAQLAGALTGLYVRIVPTGTDLTAALDELIAERSPGQAK
ncbi:hypothetical protein O7628_13040 [Micromonospora sp. WMMD956]|uniref:hypothetical protein n=1 Tax=Micromonospora sp. WMMD956 TaxID=3016108 RepID=UPI002417C12B|nr:hypothetical protein [Micromonospora sp. WMMD956]MDG4816425.1 hypothetical protein [Micromonospora sp. WMMD956]